VNKQIYYIPQELGRTSNASYCSISCPNIDLIADVAEEFLLISCEKEGKLNCKKLADEILYLGGDT
jgi:hypothetical protein